MAGKSSKEMPLFGLSRSEEETMRTIKMLEEDDLIHSEFWCRPMNFLPSAAAGCEVFPNTTSCYGGRPMNNTRWIKVRDVLGPFWFGRSVSEFNAGSKMQYEFVSGEIPEGHQWKGAEV